MRSSLSDSVCGSRLEGQLPAPAFAGALLQGSVATLAYCGYSCPLALFTHIAECPEGLPRLGPVVGDPEETRASAVEL